MLVQILARFHGFEGLPSVDKDIRELGAFLTIA
jgi:hypothetical protein